MGSRETLKSQKALSFGRFLGNRGKSREEPMVDRAGIRYLLYFGHLRWQTYQF